MIKRALHVLMAAILGSTLALAAWPQQAQALEPSVYNQPGDHYVNGRYWRTSCEMYSTKVVRCRTEIFATKVIQHNGKYYNHNGWVFNNLTYLPSDKAQWEGNPLATNSSEPSKTEWSGDDGRQWRTECNTPATGRGGCRSYVWATNVVNINGTFVRQSTWVINNILQFSTASIPPQTTIPPRSATVANMPVETEFVPPKPAPPVKPAFRADSRCLTGRALCISKDQRKMAWMIDGRIIKTFDVRFGSPATPTRNGSRTVLWKSREHVSSLFQSDMPFAMFFDGGQAVHYSSDFARRGYAGASHGCVNVRDYKGLEWLYDTQVVIGDKVIIYN